jgi:hypothetical protein
MTAGRAGPEPGPEIIHITKDDIEAVARRQPGRSRRSPQAWLTATAGGVVVGGVVGVVLAGTSIELGIIVGVLAAILAFAGLAFLLPGPPPARPGLPAPPLTLMPPIVIRPEDIPALSAPVVVEVPPAPPPKREAPIEPAPVEPPKPEPGPEAEIEEVCPYCGEPLKGRPSRSCQFCKTPHHSDCWAANRGCTTLGCRGAPSRLL